MLAKGKKVKILIKDSSSSNKRKTKIIQGTIEILTTHNVAIKTKNYVTCINLIDFETGHAVLC